ncbi:hypothetical protein DSM104299_00316 [Baekduia alba]|uniref:hypothetical protein n=1 Tax=Baekduia alba TaxID=2997333 RepID=UPI002341CE4D|nr:hypothetical protein [Baekduia alba]WCB91643.1 hypothetical protein DSM104299_00316 [Baekduia alba]
MRGAAKLAALAVLVALPAGASAASPPDPTVVTFGGTPLTVAVGSQGQLQAKRDTDTANIFYRSSSQLGDAGFFLAFPPTAQAPAQPAPISGKVFGFYGDAGPHLIDEYWPATPAQAPATGDGSAANPFTQVTSYSARADQDGNPSNADTDVATVTQTTTYVSGAQTFTIRWDVKNATASPLRFKALAAADFFFEGSDVGTGIFTPGPPRFIGGTNADTGRSGGFVEIPDPSLLPWSHYQALAYEDDSGAGNDVWTRLRDAGDAATPSYDDTVVGDPVDNAGAVEWDQYLEPTRTLAAGGVASFALMVRTALPAALQFDQTNAGAPQGVPIAFRVTAKDTAGNPFTGKKLISTISGVNPGTQSAALAADGTATVTDPGANAGQDTVVSFVDLNGNGTREANEPQGSAVATFVDKTPPTCKVQVTGDRPVGAGGQGKPLVITVNCDSPATVATTSTLAITPPVKKAVAKKKAKKSTASAAKAKHKPKAKKKKPKAKKKPKPIVVKLAPTSTLVQPGQALPVNILIPASVTKKYPGATAVATVTVTATDAAGNVATTKATKKVTIAKPKAKKKPKAKHKKKAKRK